MQNSMVGGWGELGLGWGAGDCRWGKNEDFGGKMKKRDKKNGGKLNKKRQGLKKCNFLGYKPKTLRTLAYFSQGYKIRMQSLGFKISTKFTWKMFLLLLFSMTEV